MIIYDKLYTLYTVNYELGKFYPLLKQIHWNEF